MLNQGSLFMTCLNCIFSLSKHFIRSRISFHPSQLTKTKNDTSWNISSNQCWTPVRDWGSWIRNSVNRSFFDPPQICRARLCLHLCGKIGAGKTINMISDVRPLTSYFCILCDSPFPKESWNAESFKIVVEYWADLKVGTIDASSWLVSTIAA